MPFIYGKKSRAELDTCDPRLVTLFSRLIEFVNVSILQGRRTFKEQLANIGKGVSKTINSRHIPRTDDGTIDDAGLSKAVDAAPWPQRWPKMPSKIRALLVADPETRSALNTFVKDTASFYHMQGALRAIAHYEGIPVRQGTDWDGDGDFLDQTFDDLGHIEIREPMPELKLTEQQENFVKTAFQVAAR